jgi:hypothetical protein
MQMALWLQDEEEKAWQYALQIEAKRTKRRDEARIARKAKPAGPALKPR